MGLLYDDAGHRMIPTHATKAGIRYRYYVSLPHLKGESKTVSVGSVSRIPATDVEDIIVKSVHEYFAARQAQPTSSSTLADDRSLIAEQVVRIDVHKDRLIIRFKSAGTDEGLIRQMVKRCRSLGKNRRPESPDRSSSRLASSEMKFGRPALSDARVLSTLLREAADGLMRSSQAQLLKLSRSPHGKNAACDRSI